MLYYIIFYYIILYYIILYFIVLYYLILYYIILYLHIFMYIYIYICIHACSSAFHANTYVQFGSNLTKCQTTSVHFLEGLGSSLFLSKFAMGSKGQPLLPKGFENPFQSLARNPKVLPAFDSFR